MASKPQFIYLLICAFIIAHRISVACAQTADSHDMEEASLSPMDSFESVLQFITPENETEIIKVLIKQLLIELVFHDKESPKAEPLSETERQEVNAFIETLLDELRNSEKNITTTETTMEGPVEVSEI